MKGPHPPHKPVPGLDDRTLGDFWSWAYSNLKQNTVRPVFAEWVVGTLLGVESAGRVEWDAYDLMYRDRRVEVKSAAYVQAWKQTAPSKVVFEIGKRRGWSAETNTFAPAPLRSAELYIFCLYPERDPDAADPIDVPAWRFWVVSTARLEEAFREQCSIVLSRVEQLASVVDYRALRMEVDAKVAELAGLP